MESDSSPLVSAHDEIADLATSKLDNKSHVASPSDVTPEKQNTELHYSTLHMRQYHCFLLPTNQEKFMTAFLTWSPTCT
jgi:hypothetical protein